MISRTTDEGKLSNQCREGSLGRKVGKAARKDREARNERRRAEFDERYDKVVGDPFPSEVNYSRHVHLFDLDVLHADGLTFGPSALALYPVIASRADFYDNAWRQISLDSLGRLAGLNRKTVREASDELAEFGPTLSNGDGTRVPLLERYKDESGARWLWYYRIAIVRPGWRDAWTGKYFPFYTSIIDSGLWASLSRRAKAVYIATRTRARFDAELHDLIAGTSYLRDAAQDYAYRSFELCTSSVTELCRLAGISRSRIGPVFDELHASGLVTPADGRGWLVFLAEQQRDSWGKIEIASPYEHRAELLAEIVEHRDGIATTEGQRQRWAADIRKLVDHVDGDIARVDRALAWYREHANGEYLPYIDSGRALHSKFAKLEAAVEREQTRPKRPEGKRRANVSKGGQPSPGKYGKEDDEFVTLADLSN